MKSLTLCLFFIITLMTTGCVARKFVIHSNPEGAIILKSNMVAGYTPLDNTSHFLGKSDKYYFVAMKRGYAPDTVIVSKESPPEVRFELSRIDGVSANVNKTDKLTVSNVSLLPVNVEIVLHKGVGNLDRYERSDELSDAAWLSLNNELHEIQSDTTISFLRIPDNSGWKPVSTELEIYLKSLNPVLLAYYPEPPSILDILEGNEELFSPIIEQLCNSGTKEYLVFAWCKSVKPTTGRIIGNAGLVVASAAVAGYETAAYGYPVTYSDPSVFALDNSTIFVAYIIDPATGEVLDMKQHVVPYDITESERLQELARSIILFPLAKSEQSP